MDSFGKPAFHVWETVFVEVEGPFAKTAMGNKYVIILTDLYSKWIEAKPIPEKSAMQVASFVLSTFARMGFAACNFLNMDSEFERSIRSTIHKQGLTLVGSVTKFHKILDEIWDESATDAGEDGGKACVKNDENGTSLVRGHHTPKLVIWIEENPDSWDFDLKSYLFKLRMAGESQDGDDENYEFSPFAVMYGRTPLTNIAAEDTPLRTWHRRGRGRGRRGRGFFRGSIRGGRQPQQRVFLATDNVDENAKGRSESENPLSTVVGDPPVIKRPRGRPRKSLNPMKYSSVDVATVQALAVEPCGKSKYGLRTKLKAKVKTNIVQRMLKRSASKRSCMTAEATASSEESLQQRSKLIKVVALKTDEEDAANVELLVESIHGGLDPEYILSTSNDGGLEKGETNNVISIPEIPIPRIRIVKKGFKKNSSLNFTAKKFTNKLLGVSENYQENYDKLALLESKDCEFKLDGEGDKDDDEFETGSTVGKTEDDQELDEVDENDDDYDDMSDDEDDDDDVEQDDEDYEVESRKRKKVKEDDEISKVKVSCPNCPLLLTKKEMELHSAFHKPGSKLFHCLYCTIVTGTWESMQSHMMSHIRNDTTPGAATMMKKLRGSRAATSACRKLRRKELAGSLPLRCPFCVSLRMATKMEQQVHRSCHRENNKLLYCPHCNQVGSNGNWAQMQKHLAEEHEAVPKEATVPIEERTCSRCQKVFATPEMVTQHTFIFHARDRRFQCEMCGKTFKERKSIIRHQELHANVVYQCEECPYKTKIHKDYEDHQKIHQGLGVSCEICNKLFPRRSQLNIHLESHRKDRGVAICDQCGHQSNGIVALRHHIRNVHGNQQLWQCPLCDYRGKTKSNLKGHTDRIHNKKYKCPYCEQAFLAEKTLSKHIDIYHNDSERRYPCPHCAYRAKEPKCLTEHIRVLHNENAVKFPCDFCNAQFKTKSMLRDHMPLHTGERFICQLCGYKAKYRSILYRHVKKKHPGYTLSAVMKHTPPTITETPDGRPILPPKSRGPRRSRSSAIRGTQATEVVVNSEDGIEGVIMEQTADDEEMEAATTTLTMTDIDGSGNLAFLATTEDGTATILEANGELPEGQMYIATTDQDHHIVLDASIIAEAAAGRSITLPNNLCLQIIKQDYQDGENITMQVIPAQDVEGNEEEKGVELLLLASSDDVGETYEDDGMDTSNIIIEQ